MNEFAFVSGAAGIPQSNGSRQASSARPNGAVYMTSTSRAHAVSFDAIVPSRPMMVDSDLDTQNAVVDAVYKQIFGNAYVMESERYEMRHAESMFREGKISTKDFARQVARSSTYRRRFFDACPPYRSVELNFKHLMGRAPESKRELSEHVERMGKIGWDASIDWFFDSEEYNTSFTEDEVPGKQYKGTYPTLAEFVRTNALYSYPGTTDKSLTGRAKNVDIGNPNRVLSLEGAGRRPVIMTDITGDHVRKGLPVRPDLDEHRKYAAAKSAEPAHLLGSAMASAIEVAAGVIGHFSRPKA